VVSITSNISSPLAKISDHVVKLESMRQEVIRDYIPDQLRGVLSTITPLGTLFELSASILLDSIVVALMGRLGKGEEEMRERHANL